MVKVRVKEEQLINSDKIDLFFDGDIEGKEIAVKIMGMKKDDLGKTLTEAGESYVVE